MLKGWCKAFPIPIISIIVYDKNFTIKGDVKMKATQSTAYISLEIGGQYYCSRLGNVSNLYDVPIGLLTSASCGNDESFELLKSGINTLEYEPEILINRIAKIE